MGIQHVLVLGKQLDLFEHAEGLAVAPFGSGESGAALLRNFNSCAKKT